jgi:eukaryotic-like serine/threonine-protein kinase
MSQPVPSLLEEIRFGVFAVDLRTGELHKNGTRVKLQERPFQILAILLERPGELHTREELRSRLWPDGTFVDFDHSISSAIRKLRDALNDSAATPRYIETLGRRGYRFVYPVAHPSALKVVAINSAVEPEVPETEGQGASPLNGSGQAEVVTAAPRVERRIAIKWKFLVPGVLVTIALAVGGFLNGHRAPVLTEKDTVVLADFDNNTGDPVFDETLQQALRVKLTESPYFNLVSDAELRSTLKGIGQPSVARMSPETALALCKRVGARAVLRGAISPLAGGAYRVALMAVRCADGGPLASEEAISASRDGALSVLGQATDELRQRLGEAADSVQQFRTPIVEATTNSLAALRAFSLGEEKRAEGQDYEAIPFYKMAIDLDPNFALAYARLKVIYDNVGESAASDEYLRKAFDLRERTTERERLYIAAHYYAWTGEESKHLEVFKLWRQLYPRDLVPANNLSAAYWVLGEPEKAVESAREALRLGPNNGIVYMNAIQAYQCNGQFADAKALFEQSVARKLDGLLGHLVRYVIASAENDTAEMQHQLDWAHGNPQEGELLKAAALHAASRGQMRRARSLFRQAEQVAMRNGLREFSGQVILADAQAEAAFGYPSRARAAVNRALQKPGNAREQASAAVVLAHTGALRAADEIVAQVERQAPLDMRMRQIILPTARAVAELHRNNPAAAIRQLQVVEPYDLSLWMDLSPMYYRGMAHLAAKHAEAAAAQFHKLLEGRAMSPDSVYVVLTHLALARAHLLAGDVEKARAEYREFFDLWKDADRDIPVLRNARVEYATLNSRR